jgi:hypothetical protein
VTATAIWKASGVPPPPRAQSAEQSAQTIFAGVAKNERLVLGDKDDVFGAKVCFKSRGRSVSGRLLAQCRSQEA